MTLQVEEIGIDRIACECCRETTLRFTGDIVDGSNWLAFYTVTYTAAHPENPAHFTLGIGDWSDPAKPDKRWVFGAFWSVGHQAFMLRDMSKNPEYRDAIHVDRTTILGTPFADEAFAMLDAVLLQDTRLKELHS